MEKGKLSFGLISKILEKTSFIIRRGIRILIQTAMESKDKMWIWAFCLYFTLFGHRTIFVTNLHSVGCELSRPSLVRWLAGMVDNDQIGDWGGRSRKFPSSRLSRRNSFCASCLSLHIYSPSTHPPATIGPWYSIKKSGTYYYTIHYYVLCTLFDYMVNNIIVLEV